MLTRCSDHSRSARRFPVPESLFGEATVQPYVHNCFVTVHEGRHIYRFCIFFKRHLHLRTNLLLSTGNHEFRGDAVVMRIGVNYPSVVNMRGRDTALADFIICHFAKIIGDRPRARLPRHFTLVKPLTTRTNCRSAAKYRL